MRRPNPLIGYTTALAFVLAGCAINIEPTDLSSVTVETDRTVIEEALGKPENVVEAKGLIVASYSYDKGYYRAAPRGGGGSSGGSSGGAYAGYALIGVLVIAAVVLPIKHAVETGEARAKQEGQLAAIFDADNKLVFARLLDKSEPTSQNLSSLVEKYASAQSGDTEALLVLGKSALLPDQKRSFLEMAANAGSGEAAFALGEAYDYGRGVEQSDTKAVEWWLTAAQRHYLPAYRKLGEAYLSGNGTDRDLSQARIWFAKAGENGDGEAAKTAAELAGVIAYLDGTTPATAKEKYELALAFEQGNSVLRDTLVAEDLLRQSAEGGYAPAQALMGEKILRSNSDPAEAVKWQRLAAEQGYVSAQIELGKRYLDGRGIDRDRAKAKLWFTRASEAGDKDADEILDEMASDEIEVNKLRVSAQQGDVDSYRKLGHAYHFGKGVEYDVQEAMRWYERAAEKGNVDSQHLLGLLHASGKEVDVDRREAFKWYRIAEAKSQQARSRLQHLRESMSPSQITEAERLAREWLQAHPQ